MTVTKWPKTFPPLTEDQQRISDDFMAHWHRVLPSKFTVIDRFNHSYPVRHAPEGFKNTLEIGAGLGEHLRYERLTPEQRRNYVCIDLRTNMVEILQRDFPDVTALVHDCQQPLDRFMPGHFDRVLAVHVLEHLPNLPSALQEVHRLLDREKGVFSVVIPCEGGLAYGLSRRISAQRIFEKRYHQSYRWFIEREHINRAAEVMQELHPYFETVHRSFFPFPFLPIETINLVIGMTLRPRPEPVFPAN